MLAKYFYFSIDQTKLIFETNKWEFNTTIEKSVDVHKRIGELKKFLSNEKYMELNHELVNEKVCNIETKLKYMGEATVFDCIFTDL